MSKSAHMAKWKATGHMLGLGAKKSKANDEIDPNAPLNRGFRETLDPMAPRTSGAPTTYDPSVHQQGQNADYYADHPQGIYQTHNQGYTHQYPYNPVSNQQYQGYPQPLPGQHAYSTGSLQHGTGGNPQNGGGGYQSQSANVPQSQSGGFTPVNHGKSQSHNRGYSNDSHMSTFSNQSTSPPRTSDQVNSNSHSFNYNSPPHQFGDYPIRQQTLPVSNPGYHDHFSRPRVQHSYTVPQDSSTLQQQQNVVTRRPLPYWCDHGEWITSSYGGACGCD